MPPRKFFTQEQIDNAKLSLSELPDLTPDRISREEMLSSISGDIIELSSKKGYTASDIKEALEKLDIQVSEKSISEIIRKNGTKAGKTRRKPKPVEQENS